MLPRNYTREEMHKGRKVQGREMLYTQTSMRKLIRQLLIEKVEYCIEWDKFDEAQVYIDALDKLFFWKTANAMQSKLESELELRKGFLTQSK